MAERNWEACFSLLPEGCISNILSLTTPRDACRSSAISLGFRSAAESDIIWERFLPSDYKQIISRSVTPVLYSTKKQLYCHLCDSPILLDDGKWSFLVDKKSGKKCYMLGARKLSISWGENPYYWEWTSHPDSRFLEVAKLLSVCWLDIRGKMVTQLLSPNTTYAAYLVYKIANRYFGLDEVNAYVRLVNEIDQHQAEDEATTIDLISPVFRRVRKDGWMEIELGEFFNDNGDDGEVELRLIEIIHLGGKTGLIVEGMEIRPKEDV